MKLQIKIIIFEFLRCSRAEDLEEEYPADVDADDPNATFRMTAGYPIDVDADDPNARFRVKEGYPIDVDADDPNANFRMKEGYPIDVDADDPNSSFRVKESYPIDVDADDPKSSIRVKSGYPIDVGSDTKPAETDVDTDDDNAVVVRISRYTEDRLNAGDDASKSKGGNVHGASAMLLMLLWFLWYWWGPPFDLAMEGMYLQEAAAGGLLLLAVLACSNALGLLKAVDMARPAYWCNRHAGDRADVRVCRVTRRQQTVTRMLAHLVALVAIVHYSPTATAGNSLNNYYFIVLIIIWKYKSIDIRIFLQLLYYPATL